MRSLFTSALLAILLAVGGNSFFMTSAQADSTGFASIHTLSQRGNKLCMVGHYHYGADSSTRSKADALKNAQRKWADFVIVEYGTDWGRFSAATSKGIKCSGDAGGYHCSIEASPCKYVRGAPTRNAKAIVKKRRYAKKRRYTKKRRYAKKRRYTKKRRYAKKRRYGKKRRYTRLKRAKRRSARGVTGKRRWKKRRR